MLQDSKGFIWVGTQNGLNRYDGYSFTHYFATPFDSIGLQSNSITALCEDSSGTIWIGTQDKGLNALDRKTGKITQYQFEISNATTISSNRIFCLFIDSKKRLWIGTGSGLDYFDPRTKSFLRYEFNKKAIPVLNSNQISSITEDKNGNLLIESMVGILSFNPLKGSADIQFQTDHSDMWIQNIFRTGNEWLAYIYLSLGRYAIGNINFENKKFIERYSDFPQTTIYSVLKKDSSSFFIGSIGGLYILNTRSNTLERLEISSGQPSNSSTQNIRSMMIDFNGNLWVGTFDGIYILEKSTSFSHQQLLISPLGSENNISQTIRSLYYSKRHGLMSGTKSGLLFQWDSLRNGFILSRAVGKSKKSAHGSAINSMVEDLHGRLWIANTNGPCYVLDNSIAKKKFSSHKGDLDLALGENGHTIYRDRAGMIWLGVNDRNLPSKVNIFLKYDPATNSAKAYRYFTLKNSLTEEHGVFSFLEDKDGGFWLATANGLFLFDRVNETFTPYKYDYRNTKSISSSNVWVLHEDRAGNFWVGTWGGGLNLFDRAAKTFKHFTEKDGLPSNIIFSILEAGDSTLWIGTGNGISHFDPKTKVFTNYDKSDGLLDDGFQPNAAAILPSGEMFFGGTNGVTSFSPDKIFLKDSYSPLVITSFTVLGKPKFGDLSGRDKIELPYNENDFSFDFATLDFKNPAKKRYAYRLVGLDNDWVQAGDRNFAAYNNVPPGSYIIRIKAINSRGEWDTKELAIQLVITPPFWATFWFRASLVLLILSLIALGARRRIRKKQELETSLDYARERERFNIAGELHDGPLQDLYATRFLLEKPESGIVLDGLLKKVRRDIRSITGELQIPKFETGFADEIRFLAETFQDKHPEIKVHFSGSELPFEISAIIQQNIYRIYRSSVANVAKHANAKNLHISLVTNQESLTLVIADDGKGFDTAEETHKKDGIKHYGMLLNQHYASSSGAIFQIVSAPEKGTTVTIICEKPKTGIEKYFKRRI